MGLLNFGDRVGQISAVLFTLVAVAAMIYALVTFHWRAKRCVHDTLGGTRLGHGSRKRIPRNTS